MGPNFHINNQCIKYLGTLPMHSKWVQKKNDQDGTYAFMLLWMTFVFTNNNIMTWMIAMVSSSRPLKLTTLLISLQLCNSISQWTWQCIGTLQRFIVENGPLYSKSEHNPVIKYCSNNKTEVDLDALLAKVPVFLEGRMKFLFGLAAQYLGKPSTNTCTIWLELDCQITHQTTKTWINFKNVLQKKLKLSSSTVTRLLKFVEIIRGLIA